MSKTTVISAVLLTFSLILNVTLLIDSESDFTVLNWRDEYPLSIIEIKAWVDVNGTYGFEPVPMVKMLPLNSSAQPEGYNWVIGDVSPFRLDNRYGYIFIAPEEYYGKKWLFWQSEKTFMIIPNRTLILELGFSSDCWWMNYG